MKTSTLLKILGLIMSASAFLMIAAGVFFGDFFIIVYGMWPVWSFGFVLPGLVGGMVLVDSNRKEFSTR